MKIGLKLYSTNIKYFNPAVKLFKDNIYDYIELYTASTSYQQYIDIWSNLKIPYVIHAPHFQDGLNFAKKEGEKNNLQLIKEAQQFADELKAEKIIVHPGINGDIKETSRQLQIINDHRIVIENMPYFALIKGLICNGAIIKEIKYILNHNKVGFCLDIGHAIYAANAQKIKPLDYLEKLIRLKPMMYHLSDGDYYGTRDQHLHFGKGNFPLKKIINMLPKKTMITIETIKDPQNNLAGFVKDIKMLKMIIL